MTTKKAWSHWRNTIDLLKEQHVGRLVDKQNCIIVRGDVRKICGVLPSKKVSCIITSPPYGMLKNYESRDQIGFGQDYGGEYLPDLESIFSQLFSIARDGAALWIVLDALRSNGEMIPLPWQVAQRVSRSGWKFNDLVVWDKGRSLPWSHVGRFRGVCEFILLFSKGNLRHFDLTAARDVNTISPYWVRYPERYHPSGKAPSDLWHFPIPVQGSWSNGRSKHHCPFPIGLVARMITITSKPGDIILDPFCGTGSVLATGAHLGRFGMGIEVNPKYVRAFDRFGFSELSETAQHEIKLDQRPNRALRRTIIELRMLKYAKALFTCISRKGNSSGKADEGIAGFFLRSGSTIKGSRAVSSQPAVGAIYLEVLAKRGVPVESLLKAAARCASVPPLSKFGIDATVTVIAYEEWSTDAHFRGLKKRFWYVYLGGRFFSFNKRINKSQILEEFKQASPTSRSNVPILISHFRQSIAPPI